MKKAASSEAAAAGAGTGGAALPWTWGPVGTYR